MAKQEKTLPVAASFDQILAVEDLAATPLEVPEWGCTVMVRGLSRKEFVDLKDAADGDADRADVLMLSWCLVDPKVTEEQARELLATKSVGACAKITQAIVEASGLGDLFRQE